MILNYMAAIKLVIMAVVSVAALSQSNHQSLASKDGLFCLETLRNNVIASVMYEDLNEVLIVDHAPSLV